MNNPLLDALAAAQAGQPIDADAIKKAFSAPNMRDLLAPTRAAAGRTYTADEAKQFARNIATALHRTPRFPISVTATDEADGSLTIRVIPT